VGAVVGGGGEVAVGLGVGVFAFGVGVGVLGIGVAVAGTGVAVAVGGAGVAVLVGGGGGGVMGVGAVAGGGGGVLAAAKPDLGPECIATASAIMPMLMGNASPIIKRLFIQDSLRSSLRSDRLDAAY
jgi:hypothetical protein